MYEKAMQRANNMYYKYTFIQQTTKMTFPFLFIGKKMKTL